MKKKGLLVFFKKKLLTNRTQKVVNAYRYFNKTFYSILTVINPTLNTRIRYRKLFHKKLDLSNPITLNEKILWLKLNNYNSNPLVIQCADKYLVRDYIIKNGCKEILNELINVYENVEDIKWEELPQKFVIKWNFGCGLNLICKNKEELNIHEAITKLKKWKHKKIWLEYSEMHYKHIEKKIICEKLIETDDGKLPADYKVYCFNGEPICILLCLERECGRPKFYFFDQRWSLLPLTRDSKNVPKGYSIKKPSNVNELFNYSRMLCKPFPFVRIDYYINNNKVIFGEMTFTPAAGMDSNRLPETDEKFGKLLKLAIAK